MKIQAEDEILLKYYANIMSEIKFRAEIISHIHKKAFTTKLLLTDMEFCALQLRKILELILLSTLVANKKEYYKQQKDFDKNWVVQKKIEEIKNINPNYFPLAIKISAKKFPSVIKVWELKEPNSSSIFKEKDFQKAYGFTSKYLHVQNPFKLKQPKFKIENFYKELIGYLNKIMNLLSTHRSTLCNGDIIYCEINNKKGINTGVDISYFEKKGQVK